MSENESPVRIYKFGEFKLLSDERMLMLGGHRLHLTPRVFHLLRILVENAGRLVTKETLLREIWEDSFVEEGNLNSTISRLRKILGEKPDEKRFIETIARVGYRFVAEVEVVSSDEAITPSATEAAAERSADSKQAQRRMWPLVPAAAVVVVLTLFVVWIWSRHTQSVLVELPKQKNVPSRVTDNPSDEGRATWTKDGRIRFDRLQGKEPFTFIMNADGTDVHRDSSIPALKSGLWSPDEKKVFFYKESDNSGAIYLANADGSNEIKLPFLGGNMDWAPDGSKIVYQYGRPNSDIYIYMLETGKIDAVVSDPSFDADPTFSPDGRRIAFVSGRDGNAEIYIQDLDGSNLHRLTDHPARDAFPAFSPDGTQIVFNSNREDENLDVYIMNSDGSNVRRLTNWKSDEQAFPECWSPDGTEIFFVSDRSGKDNIYIMNVEPFEPHEILSDASDNLQFPTYSPDGSKILFQTEDEDKTGQLRILDLSTKQVSTLLKTASNDGYPKFSPDGGSILFQDRINGNGEICLIRSDGTGEVQNLTNNPARDIVPSWSPDGSNIVFTSNRDGNYDLYQIYVMKSDGSNQHRIYYSSAISAYPTWSPDGRQIAFANDKEDGRSGNFEIFSIEPETAAAEKRLTFRRHYDIYPVYSPDSSRIAFVSNIDGNSEIYMMNADGSGLIRLTRDAGEDSQPSWSPDGKDIIFSSWRNGKSAIFELTVD